MALISDRGLEKSLTAAENSLLRRPSLLGEVLERLNKIEISLSHVEQSPSAGVLLAIAPIKEALVTKELLNNSNAGLKLSVAYCLSEILRITAPEPPYDDEKMKYVFQLIVPCFENLSDVSSRSYWKIAAMLDNMAKVRACVIMLDLGCEEMIIEMFRHFLGGIRAYHDEAIFASMETIMTVVLEEIDHISKEMLNPILAALTRNNAFAAMTMSKKLAERVVQNTGEKIRPYLVKAVKSSNADFHEFGEVVASLRVQEEDTIFQGQDTVMIDSPNATIDSDTPSSEKITVLHSNQSAPDPPFVCIKGHKVKTEIAPLLQAIFKKNGDITSGSEIKSPNILSFYLERLCDIYKRLEQTTLSDVTHVELNDMLGEVLDFEREKLNVGWLREHLESILQTKISFQEYLSVKEEAAESEISAGSLEKELEVYQRELSDLHRKSCLVQQKITATEEKLEAIKGMADQSRKVALVIKTRVDSLWKQSLVHGLL